MHIEICVKTGKGRKSTEEEVKKTVKRLMKLVKDVRGSVIDGRGFTDGAQIVIDDKQ